LPDGKVLVVGGDVGGCSAPGVLASAELYDPSSGTWSFTGSLNVPRVAHTATLLGNGKVLVAGGYANSRCQFFGRTNTAELYEPATGEWSFTGNLNDIRTGHTATLLSNGKVLIAGGGGFESDFGSLFGTSTTELYDPATGEWNLTGNLLSGRVGHTATLLQAGKVLVAGGCMDEECFFILGSAELYDPNTETWSITGGFNTPRSKSTNSLTTLPNGNVLLTGGAEPFWLNAAELYNPATGSWSNTGSLVRFRASETATLLPIGQVLVVGGQERGKVFKTAELYDPATGKWNTSARLNTARYAHSATLLSDGKVLVVGGYDGRSGSDYLRSAELYDPEMLDPAPTAPRIIRASVSGKKLFITGENFHAGAVILLNGEEQTSKNHEQNPQTRLIGKKAGKNVKAGDHIQVRNPDGTHSEEFIFTGS
jgi:N-acetylneuraminic acid mutarotase